MTYGFRISRILSCSLQTVDKDSKASPFALIGLTIKSPVLVSKISQRTSQRVSY